MRAAFYGRYSSDMQKETSIDDQLRNCRRYIDREGWELVKQYKDKAMSGASSARPDYQRMLEDAKAKMFDVLVLDDLSRLSRDSVETQQVIKRLKFWGLRVIGVSDGIDTNNKGYKIQVSFGGMKNEAFLDDLKEKVHRGLYGKVLNKCNAGGRSYGYKHIAIKDPKKTDPYGDPLKIGAKRELDPKQAKWLVQIFQWYADGFSPRWIAAELNRLKVSAPRSSSWSMSAIYGDTRYGTGIINNPLYNGLYIWNRSQWIKDPDTGIKKRLDRPESEWVTVDMPELRIVPKELWDATRKRQKEVHKKSENVRKALHENARTGAGPKFLFSGLLECGICGGNYVIADNHRYGCAKHRDRGPTVCSNDLKISRKTIEDRLLEGIRRDLFNDEAVKLFVKETSRLLTEHQREGHKDKEHLHQRLVQVEKEISNIINFIKEGKLSSSLKIELEKTEAEKVRIERELKTDNKGLEKIISFLPNAVDRYKEMINDLTHTLQHEVAKARYQIKQLLGGEAITLYPTEDGSLEAELMGNYAGLLKLSNPKLNVVVPTGFEPV